MVYFRNSMILGIFLRNSTSRGSFHSREALSKSLIATIFALLVCGCSGRLSTNPQSPLVVAVTITPTTASLAIGATQQFTDTVTGSSNTGVTWSVNCLNGGNSTCGTISNSGLYTAPNTLSSPGPVTVTAISQADSTKQASATVTLRLQVLSVAASPAQNMSALAALDLVRGAGARGQSIEMHWPDVEPSPLVYDFTTVINQINAIRSQGPFRIHVTLGIINTAMRQVPADLASAPFDSPQMTTRFKSMLTAFLNQVSTEIDSISIGNEVDVYLNAHPTEWVPYANFYGQAVTLVRTYISIRVGVTSTYGGAIDAQTGPFIANLNTLSDLVMMNYYPLNINFTPHDPSVVAGDFVKILAASPGKPIFLQEVGYPASTALGSSEQLQAQFVTNVFSEWMKAGDKIQFLNFFLLHDDTPQGCQQIANQIGVTDPNFVPFFCSLGLRNSDGTDKLGWTTLKMEAQAAGFTAQP